MSVKTRCTQCGTTNTNDVPSQQLEYGTGSQYGTETVPCLECSSTCNLDECEDDDPCDRCLTETVQNRCGKSVPTAQ